MHCVFQLGALSFIVHSTVSHKQEILLQLVQSVFGWNILILYQRIVIQFLSFPRTLLFFTTVLDRDVLFRFTLVLNAFPIWCCLGCDNSYLLTLLTLLFLWQIVFILFNSIDDKYNSDKLFPQQSNCERERVQ